MRINPEDVASIGRFIKRKRLEAGVSARELAARAGVSDAHIIYIEKGQRTATFPVLMNVLAGLGTDYAEVLREAGVSDAVEAAPRAGRLQRIPVVTLVMAGQWKEVSDSFEPGDADQWIESDVTGRNVFALRVAGDSMEPEFQEGEVIIVNPHVEAQPGDFVVVKNAEEEATFKQLKRFGARWVLHPLNPRYPDQEVRKGRMTIIGKVVKKEKRY